MKRLAFLVLLPPVLLSWAWATESLVAPPVTFHPAVGALIAFLGFVLLAAGFRAPHMQSDAYPVVRKIVPHPIYTGLAMLTCGAFIVLQSRAGVWLVTPMLCLALAAQVMGRERIAGTIPYIIPQPGEESPRGRSRIYAYTCLLLPWMVLYETVIFLGTPPDVMYSQLDFEKALPVIEWTELIYASPYIVVCLVPLLAKTRTQLRFFTRTGLLTMVTVFPIYLAVPFVSPHRVFTALTPLGKLLKAERLMDGAGAAFPSYHVLWALIAAETLILIYPRARWMWRVWPVLVAASCVTTGSHGVLDVIAAYAAYALIKRIPDTCASRMSLTILWGAATLIAMVRLYTIGADLRLVLGVGLMMAGAGIYASRQWRVGPLFALAGLLATVLA